MKTKAEDVRVEPGDTSFEDLLKQVLSVPKEDLAKMREEERELKCNKKKD